MQRRASELKRINEVNSDLAAVRHRNSGRSEHPRPTGRGGFFCHNRAGRSRAIIWTNAQGRRTKLWVGRFKRHWRRTDLLASLAMTCESYRLLKAVTASGAIYARRSAHVLPCMVRAAHQRTRFDVPDSPSSSPRFASPTNSSGWNIADDRQMIRRGPQILPRGENIAFDRAQIAHHVRISSSRLLRPGRASGRPW